ncbi:MAG: helix-turn-helix domain-containing protein [Magnetospirillum sp.]|nr:helix-turn-helix domain-containing protein [Magnetospirillum sp.]
MHGPAAPSHLEKAGAVIPAAPDPGLDLGLRLGAWLAIRNQVAGLVMPNEGAGFFSLLRGGAKAALAILAGATQAVFPDDGRVAGTLRIIATPWTRLVASFKAAFAPVTAEGDRQRSQAFHGQPRVETKAAQTIPAAEARLVIEAALATMPDKGDPTLPEDLSTLAILLGSPPPRDDFKASDMVRECFADHGMNGSQSRALLAVAKYLSAEFGLPTRLPLTTAKAWRMLDPALFEDEMAGQLAAIDSFIADWQKTQQSFLCLEFGEIELIEWLFESLHPGRHAEVLTEVMNFKVLSNRRQGILRRIPHRVRKFVKDCGGPSPDAISYVVGTRTFLQRAAGHGYPPIADAATASLEEVDKVLEKLRPPPPPDAAGMGGDGQALARITPVKMPASELAAAAMAGSRPPAAPAALPPTAAPPPPPRPPLAAPVQPQPVTAAPLPPPIPPPSPAAALPAMAPPPSQLPATMPTGMRPATVRLQAKHLHAGAELTIPSRSSGRIPLGRLLSAGHRPLDPVKAISVKSAQTRPGMPDHLPAPVNAVIPPALPAPSQAKPALPLAGTAAPTPPPATGTIGKATGRISLPIPGRPAATAAAPLTPPPLAAAARPPAQATGRIAPPRPAAPHPTMAVAAPPPAPPAGTNVTKLTVVPKRRLPITQNLKRQSVLRVLRGEDAETIAQSIGISRTKLDDWVDKFVTAGAGALTSAPRKRKAEELTVDTLRTKLAEVLATAQMIERVMEASLPRRPMLLAPPQETPPHRPRKKQG